MNYTTTLALVQIKTRSLKRILDTALELHDQLQEVCAYESYPEEKEHLQEMLTQQLKLYAATLDELHAFTHKPNEET